MARKQKTKWIGLDVGGANIKAASTTHPSVAIDFPLWKQPQLLPPALKKLFRNMGGAENIAVTMTGELADCFQTKREGVTFISKACVEGAGDAKVHFYSVKGEFLTLTKACTKWEEIAASNWHALASWCAKNAQQEGPGLVIDIGSTTTDIIPFTKRQVCCKGWNDTDRLLAGELVYTGVERSSIAGITSKLPLRGKLIPVMNELFATSLDAYLLLGDIAENERNTNTADGRGATKVFAHARFARMIGGDSSTVAPRETLQMATFVADRQAKLIAVALNKMRRHHSQEIHFTGHGKFLANRALKLAPTSGPFETEYFRPGQNSRCAPAVAVMDLAQEYFQS
jgi:(4-(4-[2-(gamma-L-glutamylamino)ethyl]phenoxymethyl)furan-2-yl)methanamine synthase